MSEHQAKPSPLVAEARKLMKDRDDLQARILAIEEKLIALGAGTYASANGDTCQVISGSAGGVGAPSYGLDPQFEEKARELAGEDFGKLFDRNVRFTPCQGFESVVPKILTKKAKARELLKICFIPGRSFSGRKAYVKWPKAA